MKEKKGFFAEFKKFISRGSVIDLAVGLIIGSAFTAIVTSLVNDIIMPVISLLKPGGFKSMYVGIINEGTATADVTLANGAVILTGEPIYRTYLYYGNFIQTVINFFLIAMSLFIIIKVINYVRDQADKAKNKINDLLNKDETENKEEL